MRLRLGPRKFTAWPALALGAGLASLSVIAGRLMPRHHGSQTNASEAMDDIELRPDASAEQFVDASVMETFPASDPPSVQKAFENKGDGATISPQPRVPRSADWMLRR